MKKYLLLTIIPTLFLYVLVRAQAPSPNPVVIVPGIGASWNPSIILDPTPSPDLSEWRFSPTVKQYDQLIQAFEDAGLVQGEDFFVAFYDWRQSNIDSATNYLVPIIDQALAYSDTGQVDIVAHSMGGLVARSYIQSDAYRGDVDEFIMLGTPNHGSSDVYTLWEGGDVPKNWDKGQQSMIGLLLWWLNTVSALTTDEYDTIHLYVPSVQELLPTYDYLVDKDTGDPILNGDMHERNLFLSVLNLDGNVSELLSRLPGDIHIIAGEGESTVGNIPVTAHTPKDGKLWVDGRPDPRTPERNDIGGDNRVLLSSAFIEEPDDGGGPSVSFGDEPSLIHKIFARIFGQTAHAQFSFTPPVNEFITSAKHGDLPTESIPEIFDILGLEEPAVTYEPIPEPDAILTFWFASPIDVEVTDPSGNTTTKNVSDIPGAVYDGADDPLGFKMVVIENPEAGEYTVGLTGLAAGGYHMGVGSFSSSGDIVVTAEGDVTEGKQITYTVQYDPSNTEVPTEVSEPIIEEPSALELLDELIALTEAYYDTGAITKRNIYRQLNSALRNTRNLVEREKGDKAIKAIKRFDKRVQKNNRRGYISDEATDDMRARARAIRELLKETKKEKKQKPHWWSGWFGGYDNDDDDGREEDDDRDDDKDDWDWERNGD
jgi:pimeloyl-ACP methyl ester carboxylesterase